MTPSETTSTASLGKSIAVASYKGGVGKTWFCVIFSYALAQQGHRVLLSDDGLGLANIDVWLGLTPLRDLAGVLIRESKTSEATCRFTSGGLDILAGHSGTGSLAALDPHRLDWPLNGLHAIARAFTIGAGSSVSDLRHRAPPAIIGSWRQLPFRAVSGDTSRSCATMPVVPCEP